MSTDRAWHSLPLAVGGSGGQAVGSPPLLSAPRELRVQSIDPVAARLLGCGRQNPHFPHIAHLPGGRWTCDRHRPGGRWTCVCLILIAPSLPLLRQPATPPEART